MNRKQWTRHVVRDPDTDDFILDLGDDLCKAAGWEVGDHLEWIDQGDGSWILRKVQPKSKWKNFVELLKNLIQKK